MRQIRTKLGQRDPLSTCLLNLILENIIREAGIEGNDTIHLLTFQGIAHADDIAVIARTKENTKTGLRGGLDQRTKDEVHGKGKEKRQQRRNDSGRCNFEKADKFNYYEVMKNK